MFRLPLIHLQGLQDCLKSKCTITSVIFTNNVGRDSSVDIATRYKLDGPGIESQWGRDFQHPSRPALEAHPDSYTMGTGSFL
jgi:hypothetical protein